MAPKSAPAKTAARAARSNTRSEKAATAAPELAPFLSDLARVIEHATRGLQELRTAIPGLSFFRRDSLTPPAYCFIKPSLVLVAQGKKQMIFGTDTYVYDTARFLISSLDMPARSGVLTASPERPCLGLNFELDLHTIAELIAHGGLAKPPAPTPPQKPTAAQLSDARSMGIGRVTPPLLSAFQRLLALLDEPVAIPSLAPIFQREIHYRLLTGDQAARLRKIAAIDSQSHKIAKAIDWLSVHYAAPLSIEQLAASVQMSAPNFHHHFRQLTAMSPLQYQKRLRLNEARRLMLNEQLDAATASYQVGYESPSQFSREYRRLFGAPPKRNILALRQSSSAGLQPGPQ
ncbi:AraC family transcriptional regulator [Cephaloticoccus primus]|uniref:AraC family transcriptional regulator n=1 Tax=Cephaloticoccus primus TaxID=1548207 RepID=A0A139SHM4_9BACT|nr:AraC family transcriptional regulator [Cephaloticoccus primus]